MIPPKTYRGFSLIEVLIVLALLSIAIGVVGVLMTRPQKMMDNTLERLTAGSQADIGSFELGKRLGATHIMKTGLTQCNPFTITTARAAEPNITLNDTTNRFTFAYSQYSSMVGVSTTSTTQFSTLDANKFPTGGVIVLTHINDPNFGGVYLITDSDPATNTLTLSNTFNGAPAQFGCAKGAGAVSINDLENDDTRLIMGERPRTFRADLIRFVSYYLVARPAEAGLFDLRVDEWPTQTGDDAVATRVVADRVLDFVVNLGWIDDASGTLGGRAGGTFTANYTIDRQELNTYANPSLKAGETPRTVAGRRVRAVSGGINYHMGGSLQVNFGAPRVPPSSSPSFPSCTLNAVPLGAVFRMPNTATTTSTQVVNLMRINASVTSLSGSTGSFQISGSGAGGVPSCWSSSAINPATIQAQAIPELPGVGSPNIAINATVTLTGGVSYEPVYCDMPPGSSLSATLTYIDTFASTLIDPATQQQITVPATNKPVTITCSGVSSTAGGPFVYSQQTPPSRCSTAGTITLGSLVDAATQSPGPALYYDETSCDWSDGTTASSCNNVSNTGFLNASRTLSKVRLRPTGITLQDSSCVNKPLGCLVLTCN